MERMKSGTLIILGCGLMLAWAGPAKAELMAYEFAGVVDWLSSGSYGLDGSVQVGTEFSGRFTFDSNVHDANSSPHYGSYTGPAFSMTVNVGSYSWYSGAGNGYLGVHNDVSGHDSLFFAPSEFIVDGVRIEMFVSLTDESSQVFSTDAPPILEPFPLSAFDSQQFEIDAVRISDGATRKFGAWSLSSLTVVPEPTAMLLMAFGLGLLRRR